MTLEEMKQKKKERGFSFETLSKLSGVPASTIQKIWGGVTKAPREETIEALVRVLDNPLAGKRQGEFTIDDFYALAGEPGSKMELIDGVIYGMPDNHAEIVKKPGAYYLSEEPKKYTIEDFDKEREKRAVELIDGVFYDMAVPTGVHQIIETRIIFQILQFIENGHDNCSVSGPRNVQLDEAGGHCVYEPDVVVLCDQSKDHNKRIIGAPDLVMEILSPSTAAKDKHIKLNKYEQGGVREVWLINPRTRQIITHDYDHEDRVGLYSFEDVVPVSISDGEMKINFKDIKARLDRTYGENWN